MDATWRFELRIQFLLYSAWRPWAIGAGAVVGTLLTPVMVPAGLGFIGFGAAGPLAGTFSPSIHS
jgi:hypothetical protein